MGEISYRYPLQSELVHRHNFGFGRLRAREYATEGASMFDTDTIRALALVAAMFVAFCGAVELLQQASYHEVLQN